MYHPNKTEPNGCFASMQRTFYPKHISYFGDGQGRDLQVTQNNGGLNRVDKIGMQMHHGVQLKQYNQSNGPPKGSPSPKKEPTTFYYQSDGTGRDSYVLKHNGGYRPEYNVKDSGDRLFKNTLRNNTKSPLKHFQDPVKDRADFSNYQNWQSMRGRHVHNKHARI